MSKIKLQFLILFWNLGGFPVLLPFCFRSRQVRIKVSDVAEYLLSGQSSDYWHATLTGHMTTHTGSLQDTQSNWEVFSPAEEMQTAKYLIRITVGPSVHALMRYMKNVVCVLNKQSGARRVYRKS